MRKFHAPFVLPSFMGLKDSGTILLTPAAGNDSAAAATVTMPYVADYSLPNLFGKTNRCSHSFEQLQSLGNYRYEGNESAFWDSVTMVLSDGTRMSGASDS
jgi:hypothetical protein